MKKKLILLMLIVLMPFLVKKDNKENHLSNFKNIALHESIYNFDCYNDLVKEFLKYYEAGKKYLDFDHFCSFTLNNNEMYSYNKTKLFVYKNEYSFKIDDYYLNIKYDYNFICIDFYFDKRFYLYLENDVLDLRNIDNIYFIKDKYRLRLENGSFSSILSYHDKLFMNDKFYKISENKLVLENDANKQKELTAIANIYLTEYFNCDIINIGDFK